MPSEDAIDNSDDRASSGSDTERPRSSSRPGDDAVPATRERDGGDGHTSAAVREGAATDQEESGSRGQRERGRPSSPQSAKSSKVEDPLSSLRVGVTSAGEGVSVVDDGGAVSGLLDGVDTRGRQDSSRSPLPHENAAGGEDDASVLDTPLQDQVRLLIFVCSYT